jgi:DNA polymerase III sliding clamp (beta) subunit (PCNA family)
MSLTLAFQEFANAIKLATTCLASPRDVDEAMPELTTIRLTAQPETLTVEATNRFILDREILHAEGTDSWWARFDPKELTRAITILKKAKVPQVTVTLTEGVLTLTAGDASATLTIATTIQGRDYASLIPTTAPVARTSRIIKPSLLAKPIAALAARDDGTPGILITTHDKNRTVIRQGDATLVVSEVRFPIN